MNKSDFVAVDFEIATNTRMICEIGIVEIVNGKIQTRFQAYVQPPKNHYDSKILEHNYVNPEKTKAAPTFDKLWPRIAHFFEGRLVYAHNSTLDYDTLIKNFSAYGILAIGIEKFKCISEYCKMASLEAACRYFNIPFDEKKHHNALYNAEACAAIALRYVSGEDVTPILIEEEKDTCNQLNSQSILANSPRKKKLLSQVSTRLLAEGIDPLDPANPFRGKKIVFTGTFKQDKAALKSLVQDSLGGTVTSMVTKNTNFFFIGENPDEIKLAAFNKLRHNGFEVPSFFQHDLDEILCGVWGPYQNSNTVKNLNFTYEHYTRHHLTLKLDRNLLASKEVYTGQGLKGNRLYFDIVLGNLGAFDPLELDKNTNICILSDETINKLQRGEKDETILYIENFYNNNRAVVFDFTFLSETDVLDFALQRSKKCGDDLTLNYLKKY